MKHVKRFVARKPVVARAESEPGILQLLESAFGLEKGSN